MNLPERNFFLPGRLRLLTLFLLIQQLFITPNTVIAGDLPDGPRIGGRMHVDAAIYNEDATALNNGAEIRHLWLRFVGEAPKDWHYKVQFNLAGNKVSIKDAYMKKDIGFKVVTIGQFKEPFSLEEQTGSNDITFMERALPNLFAPGRNVGAMEALSFGTTSFSAGIFGEDAGEGDSTGNGDEGIGLTARLVHAPIAENGRVIHLGFSATRRRPDAASSDSTSFDSKPESNITAVKLVGTGDILDVDYHTVYGMELAVVYGSISMQGEYFVANVVRGGALPDLGFSSGYLFISSVITGESRRYKAGKGSFGRLVPAGEGAVEIAVRWSLLDLTDKDVFGGNEENSTVGVNVYLSDHMRIMANYITIKADKVGVTEEASAIQGRLQVDF